MAFGSTKAPPFVKGGGKATKDDDKSDGKGDVTRNAASRPPAEGKPKLDEQSRKGYAKSGAALPDGSFPITNVASLKDAIHAYGRAKDPAKAKAHIMKWARKLHAEQLIPDGWLSGQ